MMEFYSAIKKNEILLAATVWMYLEGTVLSEISQTERDMPYDFTYMWNLKIKKQNRNKLRDTQNILMVDRWKGDWKMGEKKE